MKVLQINAVYGVGSTGRIIQEIEESFKEGESLIATTFTTIKKDNIKIIGSKFGWKLHALLSRLTGLQGYFSHHATTNLIKRIQEKKPDIVHLHNLHANYIHLPKLLRFLAEKDIPTVVTLHDSWFFTGKCTHYTTINCNKWQTGCYNCPKLKNDNKSWFFDRTEKMWEDKKELFSKIPRLAIIGVSDWITSEAKKSFLKDAKILKRIYNWIDTDVFYPRSVDIYKKYNLPKDKFLILCIGAGWNENSYKFKDLIKLAGKLGENQHIVLAGSVATSSPLPKNISAIGYISSTNDLAELYSGVGVFVHLSREDTFGKVIAESLACGTPVIVYNSTACPEIIGENCGFVVETGDINSILKSIGSIENNKQKYSNDCVYFAKTQFQKEKLIKETIDVYKDISV